MQFFAATTLHMKLMKYWNEVPEDHYELLKKRILEAIISYAMGPKIVLNRLCIAVSLFVFYYTNNFVSFFNCSCLLILYILFQRTGRKLLKNWCPVFNRNICPMLNQKELFGFC